jgi:hypothetical protein
MSFIAFQSQLQLHNMQPGIRNTCFLYSATASVILDILDILDDASLCSVLSGHLLLLVQPVCYALCVVVPCYNVYGYSTSAGLRGVGKKLCIMHHVVQLHTCPDYTVVNLLACCPNALCLLCI